MLIFEKSKCLIGRKYAYKILLQVSIYFINNFINIYIAYTCHFYKPPCNFLVPLFTKSSTISDCKTLLILLFLTLFVPFLNSDGIAFIPFDIIFLPTSCKYGLFATVLATSESPFPFCSQGGLFMFALGFALSSQSGNLLAAAA